MGFSNAEKLAAIERELRYRMRVYAKRVTEGKMTKALSDYQIEIMIAIMIDYQELAEKERLL